VVAVTGEQGTEKLLILSQVILSLQLSFAVCRWCSHWQQKSHGRVL